MTGETPVRFEGRVAIVTGAGGGLGRLYALELARRGARVVVNDLGGDVSGRGAGASAAEAVCAEIASAGGEALADPGSVTDPAAMAAMAERALHRFGRIDIVIANAGILRDKSFAKQEPADIEAVIGTHLLGAFHAVRAAWEAMRAQGYGRIGLCCSSSGLFGNFGQSAYGAAKTGLIGLMNTLRIEGEKHGIRVNALAPLAATRMTAHVFPEPIAEALAPELVVPGMMALVAEAAPNGIILSTGGGVYAGVSLVESPGVNLSAAATPEQVLARLPEIMTLDGAQPISSGPAETAWLLSRR